MRRDREREWVSGVAYGVRVGGEVAEVRCRESREGEVVVEVVSGERGDVYF